MGTIISLYFMPTGCGLALALTGMPLVKPADPAKLAAYFLAWLFVLTLAEEFIFRGVLQQWIEDWTWSRQAALVITSLVFVAVHLWFRYQFPNWKWLVISAAPAWFSLNARNQPASLHNT